MYPSGAALHCWPSPQQALFEISRVLKPGGVFVASTFLNALAPLGQVLGDATLRPLQQLDSRNPVTRSQPYKQVRAALLWVGLNGGLWSHVTVYLNT